MNEKIRQIAVKAYDDLESVLLKVFKDAKSALQKGGKDVDIRFLMGEFDVLLQYSMMQVALEDNYLHEEEVIFIKGMARYFDYCDYLKAKGFDEITWEDIYYTKESVLQDLLDNTKEEMIKLSQEFLTILTLVDVAIKEISLAKDLLLHLFAILSAVAYADGNCDREEVKAVENSLIFQVFRKIAEYVDKKHEEGNDINQNATKKSLKDFFVKKK